MSYSRRAAHADPDGHGWYDAAEARLASTVSDYFAHTQALHESNTQAEAAGGRGQGGGSSRLLALIAPHAGLSYCGATSAEAYTALWRYLYPANAQSSSPGSCVRRVFVLGPSHHKGFEGVELSAASQYETPFGPLRVDTDTVAAVKEACRKAGVPAAFTTQRVDEEEHSIELQMPFLSYILHHPYTGPGAGAKAAPVAPHVSLVPIIVGWADRTADARLSKVLQPYMQSEENVFVLSSDFSHWGSRFHYTYHYKKETYPQIGDAIIAMDHAAMDLLEAKDLSSWYKYFSETDNTICGRHPISVGLHWWASRENGNDAKVNVEFVSYSQSNVCKNARDSSVSYASAVVRQVS